VSIANISLINTPFRLIATQEENTLLKERIHLLEDVLKKFRHSSGAGHAGLDDVMSNRNDYDNLQHSGDESEDEEEEGDDPHPLDALGNLTLRDEGSSTFHGTLAHTEVSS